MVMMAAAEAAAMLELETLVNNLAILGILLSVQANIA